MDDKAFRFVPPHIIDMGVQSLNFLPDAALEDIKKRGSFSAYEVFYRVGEDKHSCMIPYDFGAMVATAARGAVLALHVAEQCGIAHNVPTLQTPAEPISDEEAAELPPAEAETVIETVDVEVEAGEVVPDVLPPLDEEVIDPVTDEPAAEEVEQAGEEAQAEEDAAPKKRTRRGKKE